eukprot:5951188-Lingulodinium_polyedra.AAC.1
MPAQTADSLLTPPSNSVMRSKGPYAPTPSSTWCQDSSRRRADAALPSYWVWAHFKRKSRLNST